MELTYGKDIDIILLSETDAIMTIKAQAPETTQFFFLNLLLRYADMRAISQRTLNRKNLKKEAGPS